MRVCTLLFLSAVSAVSAGAAQAQTSGQTYLQLQGLDGGLQLRADVAVHDLDALLDLDANLDGQVTWLEVKRAKGAISEALRRSLWLADCPTGFKAHDFALEERKGRVYAAVTLQTACSMAGQSVSLSHSLLHDIDPAHRVQLRWRDGAYRSVQLIDPGRAGAPLAAHAPAFLPSESAALLALAAAPDSSTGSPGLSAGWQGVHAFLDGPQRWLLLLGLLLPAGLRWAACGSAGCRAGIRAGISAGMRQRVQGVS